MLSYLNELKKKKFGNKLLIERISIQFEFKINASRCVKINKKTNAFLIFKLEKSFSQMLNRQTNRLSFNSAFINTSVIKNLFLFNYRYII
jgi:hypothetical protein